MTRQDDQRPAVVVTGVSSGIGLAIAEDLLGRGHQVFGSVRKLADAQALTARWGEQFVPLVFDVTDSTALPGVVAQVQTCLGGRGLRALVNNAGISLSGPLMHQPLSEVRQVFEVNVFGLLAVSQAFLPLLGARKGAGQPPGRIVNIGSVSGAITVPFMGAYSGAKHAVEAFTQALRRELIPYGIQVSAVEPGFIRSNLFDKNAAHVQRSGYESTDYAPLWAQFNASLQASEAKAKPASLVTQAVRHAIESPKPRTRYPLDAIWTLGRVLPDRMFDKLIFKALGMDQLVQGKPFVQPTD
jgi:NAD(P)-dependent dehydrogenase (short-subunit alcohol dehydrogenase family)